MSFSLRSNEPLEGTPLLARETELQSHSDWQGVAVGTPATNSDGRHDQERPSVRNHAPVIVIRDTYDNYFGPIDDGSPWSCSCSCMLCSLVVFLCLVIAFLIVSSILKE